MNVIGLNDNNKLRSDYVYDTNQGKTQAEINANQATVNANQATVNNSKANVQTSSFSNVEFFRNITDSRYIVFSFKIADQSGLFSGYDSGEVQLNTVGLQLLVHRISDGSWLTIMTINRDS